MVELWDGERRKNKWFQAKAAEASAGRNGGKVVWKCIRDIQKSRRGMVPMRAATVKDEDGSTPDSQQQRLRRHFTKVLNIESVFSDSDVASVRQWPERKEMAEPPSEEELLEAVMKLKSRKAAGETGILPEMVKATCCDIDCVEMLVELTCGKKVVSQQTGVTLCSSPFQRREI